VVDARASVLALVEQMRSANEVAAAAGTPGAATTALLVTNALTSRLSLLVATEDGLDRHARRLLAHAPLGVVPPPAGTVTAERSAGTVATLFSFYARAAGPSPPSLPAVAAQMLSGGDGMPTCLFFAGLAIVARAVVAGTDGLTVTAATGGRLLAAGVAVAAAEERWGEHEYGDVAWAAAGVTADDERDVLGSMFGQLVGADVDVMDELDVAAWAHVVAVLHDVYGHGHSR